MSYTANRIAMMVRDVTKEKSNELFTAPQLAVAVYGVFVRAKVETTQEAQPFLKGSSIAFIHPATSLKDAAHNASLFIQNYAAERFESTGTDLEEDFYPQADKPIAWERLDASIGEIMARIITNTDIQAPAKITNIDAAEDALRQVAERKCLARQVFEACFDLDGNRGETQTLAKIVRHFAMTERKSEAPLPEARRSLPLRRMPPPPHKVSW